MLKNNLEKLLLALLISLGVACDQTTKRIAEHNLNGTGGYSFFYDTFRLTYIENPGAFLGFGSHFPEWIKLWLFLIMPTVLIAGALGWLMFSHQVRLAYRVMVAMFVAGGIGNLIDRMLLDGHVTDFMNLGIGSFRTGIFNIADVILMMGAFGLFFLEIKSKTQENTEKF